MFYLTLPSNSSMDYFPNNTLVSFTTRLPQMLDLDGFWERGLAEIQYLHSWYNVHKNEAWILFTDSHHEKHVLVLPEGYYASPKKIVKAFEATKQQKEMKKGFSLNMSEVDDKATLWVRDISQVIISPLLKSLLGFDKLDFSPGNHKAPYVSDVHQGHHSLYLYCPLKESRRCPSSLAENSTGDRKTRKNDDSRLRPHTILPPSTTPIPGHPDRYKGRYGKGRPIRTRDSGGDTSL